ncbi:MAG: hypothetical protein HQL66_03945 [Magnetococcales bacterium]|nr:hypothetical protein [Magnetococcales bacterium]
MNELSESKRFAAIGEERDQGSACWWRGRWFLVLIALVSVLLEGMLVARTPQGLTFDPAPQILALRQYRAGQSPSPNHVMVADPQDLSRDQAQWISVRPPGTQLLVWPFLALGANIGEAVRGVVLLCLLAGGVGWALWFGLFQLPARLLLPTVFLLPWMRYAGNNLIWYQTELLLFAIAPWLLLGGWGVVNLPGASRRRWLLAVTLGFGCGLAYIFKSSGAFLVAGILAYLLTLAFVERLAASRRSARRLFPSDPAGKGAGEGGVGDNADPASTHTLLPFAMLTALASLPLFLAWSILNHKASGHVSTFDQYMAARGLTWPTVIHLLGYPALAMGSAGEMLKFLLLNQYHKVLYGHPYGAEWVSLLGIPGSLFLYASLPRRDTWRGAGGLAATVLVITLLGLAVVWSHADIGYEVRYVTVSALALTPVLLQVGWRIWRRESTRRATRAILVFCGMLYLWGALGYGVISLVGKVVTIPAGYQTGVSGTYNPFLASAAFPRDIVREVSAGFDPTHDLWVVATPNAVLDLPGRGLIISDWESTSDLRQLHFATSRSLTLHALIAKEDEANDKGPAIRSAFTGVVRWEHIPLAGSLSDLWLGVMPATHP